MLRLDLAKTNKTRGRLGQEITKPAVGMQAEKIICIFIVKRTLHIQLTKRYLL